MSDMNKLQNYLKSKKLKRDKRFLITKKVDDFFIFILNPFEYGFYTNLAILSTIYYIVDHEVVYWSTEFYLIEFGAIFISFIILPSLWILSHYVAKTIDSLRRKY